MLSSMASYCFIPGETISDGFIEWQSSCKKVQAYHTALGLTILGLMRYARKGKSLADQTMMILDQIFTSAAAVHQ